MNISKSYDSKNLLIYIYLSESLYMQILTMFDHTVKFISKALSYLL